MSGRNHSTTVSTINKLCDGLGITIKDFSTPSYSGIWNKKFNKNTLVFRIENSEDKWFFIFYQRNAIFSII